MKVFHDELTEMSQFMDGAEVRFVHSESISIAEWEFKAGLELPEHSHPHEQITKVIAGEFEVIADGKGYLMKPGATLVIPPNTVHSGLALTACHVLDAFHPVREDFLASTDTADA